MVRLRIRVGEVNKITINGKEYNKEELNQRADGRVEWVCEHGVGHTIYVPKKFEKENAWWVHGCDGCCGDK